MSMLDDSGHRTQFGNGAVRERAQGKGRYDLIPPEAMAALAAVLEGGAIKYGDRNWERGIPQSTCLDSGLRHFFKLLAGESDEDHAALALANLAMFITLRERGIGGGEGSNVAPQVEPMADVIAMPFPGAVHFCGTQNEHEAHSYTRSSSGAVLWSGADYWCDGYVSAHKQQLRDDLATVERATKPRPIKDAPQA